MNIWRLNKWKKYFSPEIRKGLRIKCSNNVNTELKLACLEFAKWLREQYYFPVRIPIYLHDAPFVRTSDGDSVDGYFFEPLSYNWEPYICVATGKYESTALIEGSYSAIASVLFTIAHELTHYFQWINGVELTEIGSERQATNYGRLILWDYMTGRYKELYTTAVWNILGCSDASAVIKPIEIDNFGRVLFKFSAHSTFYLDAHDKWLNAFVICQKADEEQVYYYADICFVISICEQEIDEYQISTLKENNDWNNPIDDMKLTGRKILTYRCSKMCEFNDTYSLVTDTSNNLVSHEELFFEYIGITEDECIISEKSAQDKYGRSLYFFRTIQSNKESKKVIYNDSYVMIINPDGTFARDTFVVKLDDAYAYAKQLATFKALNHWDEVFQKC